MTTISRPLTQAQIVARIAGSTIAPAIINATGKISTTSTAADSIETAGSVRAVGARALSIGETYYGWYGDHDVTRAASGTHSLITEAYFTPPNILGSGSTITDATTVFISGAPSSDADTNMALYVFSGFSRIRDRLGIGAVTSTTSTLEVLGASDTNWIAKFRTATGLGTPFGVSIEENTGASPDYPLFDVSNNGLSSRYFRVNTGGQSRFGANIVGSERVTIDSLGMRVAGPIWCGLNASVASVWNYDVSGSGHVVFGTNTAHDLRLLRGGSARVIITADDVSLQSGYSLELPADQSIFIGERATDGSWRIVRSGDNLIFQRRESSTYVTKSTIAA